MGTRTPPTLVGTVLAYDVALTKKFVTQLLRYKSFKSLQIHGKFLEISCHGVVWLATWLAFIWIVDNKNLYQMQLNMMIGLIADIIVIALLKATFRRRRPVVCDDMMALGPDKFSFPSGHASRSALLVVFFTMLYPVPVLLWPPIVAWAGCVCLSRVVLSRHYLLDVSAGIFLGIAEAVFLSFIWISQETATNIINYISSDNLPGGAD